MKTLESSCGDLPGVNIFENPGKAVNCVRLDLAWNQVQELLHTCHLLAQLGRRGAVDDAQKKYQRRRENVVGVEPQRFAEQIP